MIRCMILLKSLEGTEGMNSQVRLINKYFQNSQPINAVCTVQCDLSLEGHEMNVDGSY